MNLKLLPEEIDSIPKLFSVATLYILFCTSVHVIPYFSYFGIKISNYASLSELSFWALEHFTLIITSSFTLMMFNNIFQMFSKPKADIEFGTYFNKHGKWFGLIIGILALLSLLAYQSDKEYGEVVVLLTTISFGLTGFIYCLNYSREKDNSRLFILAIVIPLCFFTHGIYKYLCAKKYPDSFSLISHEGQDIINCKSSIIGVTSSTIFIFNLELNQTEIIDKSGIYKIVIKRKQNKD